MEEQITQLSIDLESYSDIDLKKSGVYKYAESPNFDILLFGYSVNGGPVKVIDIASGEIIPEEILAALTDKAVIKWAHNSSFERVCISSWLRKNHPEHFKGYGTEDDTTRNFLDPSSWKCTMVWGAYMGLPLSLKGVGAVLKLNEQKMSEGEDLIRYFCKPCKPTKSNGNRTRNLPEHAPDKWNLFKEYNKRDVEVELAIKEKLKNFPVPDFIWDEYHIDQEINDRGIGIDMQLVENAILADSMTKDSLISKMQNITGLENPNSISQMKAWLSDNGLETESLDKKAVKELIPKADEKIADVLSCRQQLAKSSVSKYKAMENAVCADERARGMFQFYGANRTGRFCLTGDHEVLTDNGWMRLDEWGGGRIAVWNKDSEAVSFQAAESLQFDYSGPMYTYKDSRIDQCSTPDHKMRVQKRFGSEWTDMTVEEMSHCRPCIPMNGYRYHRGCANPTWLRVLIMTQADGHYTSDGSIRFNFKKVRKIERCKMLLRKAEIPFSIHEYKGGVCSIDIPARAVPLWLRQFRTKTFGYWLLDENPDIFFDELPNWDGYYPAPNSIHYSTTNKQNADIVQALAHMSGRCCSMKIKRRVNKPERKDAYVLNIWLSPGNRHELKVKPEVTDFKGKVYCASTTTGYFLVRRNGRVWVTGNSGRIIQLQNLPQNHMEDLAEARNIVRSGNFHALELIYDNVPQVLSELIRTAFVPRAGYKFIVCDFSSIEARVLAFLAGEQWVLDTFASGGDIYCATASRMFGVPVEKHGVNAELRQKGKQATLSCGYGGSVGALKAMGAIEAGMKEEELQPLVTAWRNANPNIVKLWWDMDKAVKKAVAEKTSVCVSMFRVYCQSGMLFIDLPSGRCLSYVKPKIGINQFGSDCVTYEGTNTGKWGRIESYGPKFIENCLATGTRIITNHGIKCIENLSDDDLLWDGIEWVSHEGLIYKGIQKTVNISGIHMTPEHKILTEKGMVECAKSTGLNWAEIHFPSVSSGQQLPDRIAVNETGYEEPVYDIKNCGTRHRFAVYAEGKIRIVSNCTQAVSRDILAYSMKILSHYFICGHVHDELIIECTPEVSVDSICDLMSMTPPWIKGLNLNADGYECFYYEKR